MNKLVLLGVATTGVVAVGSGGLYMHYRNTETIPQKQQEEEIKVLTGTRLTFEGFQPLKLVASDPDLKAVLAKYKVATKNTFKGIASQATEETLITKCTKALAEKSDNESNYKLANQWCVKESTIEKIFQNSGWKPLVTDGDDDKDGHWAKKVVDHKASQVKNKITVKLNGDSAANIVAMKNACKNLNIKTINTTTEDFNTKFEQIKDWCAIKEG